MANVTSLKVEISVYIGEMEPLFIVGNFTLWRREPLLMDEHFLWHRMEPLLGWLDVSVNGWRTSFDGWTFQFTANGTSFDGWTFQFTANGTSWDFKCQHGPDECYGNMVQACIISQVTSGRGVARKNHSVDVQGSRLPKLCITNSNSTGHNLTWRSQDK